MAIEAVQKAAAAYQGSVPEAEPVKPIGEGISVGKHQERVSEFRPDISVPVQRLEKENRSEGMETGASDTSQKVKVDAANLHEKQNERIKKAIEEINKNAKNSEAIFGIHDATNRVTIKIVDSNSKKVLKEYPPERTLDMIAKVWELAGLMVDEKR